MKGISYYLFAALIASSLVTGTRTLRDSDIVLRGSLEFTKDVYRILSSFPGNIVYSPLSTHAALSLLYMGSAGRTEETLSNILRTEYMMMTANGYLDIVSEIEEAANVTAILANKLYLNDGLSFDRRFKTIATQKFHTATENIDFKSAGAAATINSWVENSTFGKIHDLFLDDDFKDKTIGLVMVNTLYFKGRWYNPFFEELTTLEAFHVDDEKKVDVQMMIGSGQFMYSDNLALDAKIIEMPFENYDFSMVLMVPNSKTGLEDLEKKILVTNFDDVMNNLRLSVVVLRVPRFKVESVINLKDILKQIGLEILFDENRCELPHLVANNSLGLYVSETKQKAFIEVNEKGVEAAAATDFKTSPTSRAERLTVDHPFLFAIVQKINDQINLLFIGRVQNPDQP